jgi:DnaJ-class molecular chaperone
MVQATEQEFKAAFFQCRIHGKPGIPCESCIKCPKCEGKGKEQTPRGMIECPQCKGYCYVDRITRTVLGVL